VSHLGHIGQKVLLKMALRCYPAWLFWYDIQKRGYLMGKKALHLLFLRPGETPWNHSKKEAALAL
jgi:hypothetical protein